MKHNQIQLDVVGVFILVVLTSLSCWGVALIGIISLAKEIIK